MNQECADEQHIDNDIDRIAGEPKQPVRNQRGGRSPESAAAESWASRSMPIRHELPMSASVIG